MESTCRPDKARTSVATRATIHACRRQCLNDWGMHTNDCMIIMTELVLPALHDGLESSSCLMSHTSAAYCVAVGVWGRLAMPRLFPGDADCVNPTFC